MTKEEFVKKMLLIENSENDDKYIKDYETNQLKQDLLHYYLLKLHTEFINRLTPKLNKKIFLPIKKKKAQKITDTIRKQRDLMYNPNIEYNFIEHITNNDLNLLLDLIGKLKANFKNSLLRLYHYGKLKNLSAKDVLRLNPEETSFPEWFISVGGTKSSEDNLNLWKELHPEYKEGSINDYEENDV